MRNVVPTTKLQDSAFEDFLKEIVVSSGLGQILTNTGMKS